MVPSRLLQLVFVAFLLRLSALSTAEDDPLNRAVERANFNIDEGQPPGSFVGAISTRPGFTYRFSEESEYFSIDSISGEIRTKATIDRESLSSDLLSYVVFSSEPTYPIEVRITVDDINDNSPNFPESRIYVSFSESARTGTSVILDTATDLDSGSYGITENYAIVGGNTDDELFRLVVTTNPSGAAAFLHVVTTHTLDREAQDFYQLNISAQDGGIPPRFGFLLVDITIRDANDNPPVFDPSEYEVSLIESIEPDTLVLTVRATDRDIGENAEIIYFLDEREDLFTIHPSTGEIRTLRELDFESNEIYTVTVEAKDKGNPTQYGRAYVHVRLLDENDHSPVITFRFIPSSETVAKVAEETAVGTIIAIATVTDEDEGLNGQTSIQITRGNEQEHFRIYPLASLYAIQVAASLDRERISQYNLTFFVKDFGSPPRYTFAYLIIYVTDANDHAPEFEYEQYEVTLSEDLPSGSFVESLTATDEDADLNAQIFYRITEGNDLDWFEIDENTGLITTKSALDREIASRIVLNITAQDQGATQHLAETHIIINIADENDDAPTFVITSYNVTIMENFTPPREVVIVSATDMDSGVNGEVSYTLADHVEMDYPGVFTIIENTGKIMTLVTFDRETIPEYTLSVIATDGGVLPRSSTTQVNLKVGDLNDNSPIFYPVNYYGEIDENQPAGTTVKHGQVSATDLDFGSYGRVAYTIIQGNSDGRFSIDRNSGVIIATTSLDREQKNSYQLIINAQDDGGRSAIPYATVHITVVDILDNPPQFDKLGYTFEFFENVALGHSVGRVSASTGDQSSILSYAISSGDRDNVFQIDSVSGEITTAKEIDREVTPFYQLTVIVNGGPVVGQTLVNITISDKNDNSPEFPQPMITTAVVENWSVGHEVQQIHATDRDDGPNGQIVYELLRNPDQKFRIDETTGWIYLNLPVDSSVRTYYLQVLVTDFGVPQLSSILNVTVEVRDINDHSPVFVQTRYQTDIIESISRNTQFFQVSATDQDLGQNGLVTYSVTQGNTENKFGIFPDGNLC
ncbi:protocadherin Fat 4-like [Saccoglossus kowalevskii]|uniref:Protocadherin Fat 4-like n=1 Tax=Saccoglossus kowalevskii TaxID=10224 RepID=A0ABM0LXH0_SACKO|nr:PREDICTED: protocadherin Fat 4-like [Saccoglossus kowalevskii]